LEEKIKKEEDKQPDSYGKVIFQFEKPENRLQGAGCRLYVQISISLIQRKKNLAGR
jgi:hypothetical protein